MPHLQQLEIRIIKSWADLELDVLSQQMAEFEQALLALVNVRSLEVLRIPPLSTATYDLLTSRVKTIEVSNTVFISSLLNAIGSVFNAHPFRYPNWIMGIFLGSSYRLFISVMRKDVFYNLFAPLVF